MTELQNGIAYDISQGLREAAADKHLLLAQLHLRSAARAAAQGECSSALALDKSTRRAARAGMLLAQAGFLSEARRILNDLHAHVDIPRLVAARHRLAGEIALVERAPRRALREFQEAAVISPARECMEQIARALDATGDLNQAIAAYKKITETPALFWPGPQTDIPGLQSESRRRYAELVTNLTLKEKK